MCIAGLGVLFHRLRPTTNIPGIDGATINALRKKMHQLGIDIGGINPGEELPRPRIYPALESVDFKLFKCILEGTIGSHADGEFKLWV
ncbi:hypothetical protein QBC35DRAFT_457013 [Podospora australis]|uniref:Uncharacterized protein n=1 Tax=Podospora australis TaxID=1536484 RepID=A0AAN6WJU1_9PEZI|nr:hypothetical protein QBC35DRAFT_457013 [Podospora australis]